MDKYVLVSAGVVMLAAIEGGTAAFLTKHSSIFFAKGENITFLKQLEQDDDFPVTGSAPLRWKYHFLAI